MILKSKFETLRDLIKKDIISGKYLPGMSLPTEGEFREHYDANHSTINKAVAALATEGFIKTKPRTGSVVLPVKKRKIPARLGVYVMRSTGHIFEKLNSEVLNALQMNYYFPLLINLDFIIGEKNLDWLRMHLVEAINSMPEFMIIDGQAGFSFDFLIKHIHEIENLIFVNRFEYSGDIPSIKILSDYEYGGYLAAKHLLDNGCKNLLVTVGVRDVLLDKINISYAQIKGIRKAMTENGLDPDNLVYVARNDADYAERLKHFFSNQTDLPGIFSDSDFYAYKTIQILDQAGIKFKRDYKLVGYFDTPWASDSWFPFTSVTINQKSIAAKLNEIISEKNYEKKTWKIKPELVCYE